MKIIKTFILGSAKSTSYLIEYNSKNIMIDAGENIYSVVDYLTENKIILHEVWLTHCHYDHIAGIKVLVDEYPNVVIYSSPLEIPHVKDPNHNLSNLFQGSCIYMGTIKSNENLANEDLQIIYVTGHSKQRTCYYFKEERICFTGDTLFRGSVGRSDFINGNEQLLMKDIKEKLITLEPFTKIFPGHGFSTTIKKEIESNVYLKEII